MSRYLVQSIQVTQIVGTGKANGDGKDLADTPSTVYFTRRPYSTHSTVAFCLLRSPCNAKQCRSVSSALEV